ncbi:MAG: hypothetical protein JW810_08625 [Sedimentisphaerales bacterium]|nr:hypothetical protein [Sedimentisphaerales bacterium]
MWKLAAAFGCGALLAGLLAWWLSLRWARRRHRKEKELLRRTRRAEKLAELGALTSGLAHEIRNPLSTIKMNLQLLAEDITRRQRSAAPPAADEAGDETGQMYRRDLRKIELLTREADRLADTLNDFLRYAGKLELHPVRCNLNELLDELLDFYEPQALNQHIRMRRDWGREPLWCRLDVDLIKQAILNLFINATQAMAGGGELIVRGGRADRQVRIEIIDTGPGMTPQIQERIFEAYFTTKTGGSGLGLPICRRIVEEHDGRIELHSEPGKGSSFTIWLPRLEGPDDRPS